MPTRNSRECVAIATQVGGIRASRGKSTVLVQYEYIRPSVRNRAFRLLDSVMAIIGKLVDKVNTGNKAKNM